MHVTVAVYDALGRRIAVLHDGLRGPGTHTLCLDAPGWPSGPYLVRVTTASGTTTQRVTRLR